MSGKLISGPAAALLLLLFFMPWVTVSCGGLLLGQFSGYDLAVGGEQAVADQPVGLLAADAVPGDALLFLLPLAAIAAAALLLLGWQQPQRAQAVAAGLIVSGAVPLLILFLKWLQVRDAQDPLVQVTLEPALWGTLLAPVFIIIGGVVEMMSAKNRSVTAAPAHSPPYAPAPSPPVGAPAATPPLNPPKPVRGETALEEQTRPQSTPPPPIPAPLDGAAGSATARTVVEADWLKELASTRKADAAKTIVDDGRLNRAGWLTIVEGEGSGDSFSLGLATLLGRGPTCDIVLADTAVSARHARIMLENRSFILEDLNSTNGTSVYDRASGSWLRVKAHQLQDDDRIKLGRTVLHLMVVG